LYLFRRILLCFDGGGGRQPELPQKTMIKERLMRTLESTGAMRILVLSLLALAVSACGKPEQPAASATDEATEAAAPMASAKIPVTTSSEEARKEFEAGRTLFNNLHFTESRAHFERAVELDPNFAMGHVFMANSSQSAALFFDALEKAEANAAGASKGEQLVIRALGAGARNDQAAQRTALTELVGLHPKDERTHNGLANYLIGQQDYDGAVMHYGHAIAINPEFATAYNSLGYAHRANEDLDSAKNAFAQYVELIPDEANPYDSYAELLMEMGQYDEAVENYGKALAIDPHFAGSFAGISVAQSLKGDAAAAHEAAAGMLAAARTPAEKQAALLREITSDLFEGDTDGALAASEERYAVAEAAGDHAAMANAREYMGDIMLDAGDTAKAGEYHDAALAHLQQANINDANKAQGERNRQFKSAIAALIDEDLEAATAMSASYAAAAEANGTAFERRRVHELAGYLAMLNEDSATALAELAQANQVNPIVLYWSAVANRAAGNNDAALDLANRAANRYALSNLLPFIRPEALALIAELSEG